MTISSFGINNNGFDNQINAFASGVGQHYTVKNGYNCPDYKITGAITFAVPTDFGKQTREFRIADPEGGSATAANTITVSGIAGSVMFNSLYAPLATSVILSGMTPATFTCLSGFNTWMKS